MTNKYDNRFSGAAFAWKFTDADGNTINMTEAEGVRRGEFFLDNDDDTDDTAVMTVFTKPEGNDLAVMVTTADGRTVAEGLMRPYLNDKPGAPAYKGLLKVSAGNRTIRMNVWEKSYTPALGEAALMHQLQRDQLSPLSQSNPFAARQTAAA